MTNLEKNFNSSITNDEKFDENKESLDWGKYREIKESGPCNYQWKVYEFSINANSDKQLSADEVKNIIEKELWYSKNAISLIKGKYPFNSWICRANETVYVYVDTVQDSLIKLQNESKNNQKNTQTPEQIKQKSIYDSLIEKQTPSEKIRYWNKEKPELTLTIDDGNGYDDIKAILDILKEENIKTTFFIKWDRLDFEDKQGRNNKELRIRAKNEWHQICCHTYSHIYLSKKSDVTDLTSWWSDWNNIDINTWSSNVKKLLWNDYYDNLKKLEISKWINFPKSVSSDILLEAEILMWEKQIKNVLWEEYLQKFKKEFPFIRLPWWNGLEREKNIAVLKKLWYLSIYWSDDFLNKKDSNGKRIHDSVNEMNVQNWWIPLFHFKWATEQNYMRAYIKKARQEGKTFKPLSDTLTPPTND